MSYLGKHTNPSHNATYMTYEEYETSNAEMRDMYQNIATVSCVPLPEKYRRDAVHNEEQFMKIAPAAGAQLTLDSGLMAFTLGTGAELRDAGYGRRVVTPYEKWTSVRSRRITGPKGIPALTATFNGIWAPRARSEWKTWIQNDVAYFGQIYGFAPGTSQKAGDQTAGDYPGVYGGRDIAAIVSGKVPIVNNTRDKTFMFGDLVGPDFWQMLEDADTTRALTNHSFAIPKLTYAGKIKDQGERARAKAQATIVQLMAAEGDNMAAIADQLQVFTNTESKENQTTKAIGRIMDGGKPGSMMSMIIVNDE